MEDFPRIGAPAIYPVNGQNIPVQVTGVASYLNRADCWQIEWVDTTNRPVSAWVEASQILRA